MGLWWVIATPRKPIFLLPIALTAYRAYITILVPVSFTFGWPNISWNKPPPSRNVFQALKVYFQGTQITKQLVTKWNQSEEHRVWRENDILIKYN